MPWLIRLKPLLKLHALTEGQNSLNIQYIHGDINEHEIESFRD